MTKKQDHKQNYADETIERIKREELSRRLNREAKRIKQQFKK